MTPLTDRKLSELTFVAFDLETTGLDPRRDRIVEVGAVMFDGDSFLDAYEQLVNPRRPIPVMVSRIHGITDRMVAGSPAIDSVLPEVGEFFGDSVLLAHNARFDVSFLDAALAYAGIEPYPNPVLCTRKLARAVILGLPDYRLMTLAEALGIHVTERHRAMPDAGYSAEIFAGLVSSISPAWGMTFGNLLVHHGPELRFGRTFGLTLELPGDFSDSDEPAAGILEAIEDAARRGTSVTIEYRAAGGDCTRREITPCRIDGPGGKVIAYCHLRGENRTFRLDCILRIV